MSDVKTMLLVAEIPLLVLVVILLVILIIQQVLTRRAQEEATEAQAEQDAVSEPEQETEEEPEETEPEEEAAVADETAAEEEEPEQTEETEAQDEEGNAYNLTDNSVVFERGNNGKQTWAEKYETLEEEQRKLLDEVFKYITKEEDVRRLDLTSNVRVKYKTHELFKADIKRGVPVLNFMLSNTTLMRYVKESGTKKIKITPVTVKLNDNDDLQLALHTADMALEQAKSEEEFKKEKRKEQRREREQAKRSQ